MAPAPQHQIAALLEALTAVRPRSTDIGWIERPGWLQCVAPTATTVYQNTVFLSIFPNDATASDVEAGIDAAIEEYRRRGLKFRWLVGPWTRPVDLPERLLAKGLRLGRTAFGMASERAPEGQPPMDPRASVEMTTQDTAEEWSRVYAECWGLPPDTVPASAAAMRRSLADTTRLHFLARFDGKPAGIGSLAIVERSGYLYNSAVLPGFRRKGLFRALVTRRRSEAAARGRSLLTLYAFGDTSFPLLRKMGFESILESPQYFWEP